MKVRTNGNEPGQDDRRGPVFLEEGVRLCHVVLLEEAGVFLFEQRGPDPAADEVAGLIAENRGQGDGRGQHPDVEGAVGGQQTTG